MSQALEAGKERDAPKRGGHSLVSAQYGNQPVSAKLRKLGEIEFDKWHGF